MKKVFSILALIMLIITILKINDTYAKYYTKATAQLEQDIGNWIIKVNEMNIYSEAGDTVSYDLSKVTNFTNTNTSPDKISPESVGYTDITIDATGTDVAVKYSIEFDFQGVENGKEISELQNSEITFEASVVGKEKQLKKTGPNTYTGVMTLEEINASQADQVRCSVTWKHKEENNPQDTELGSKYGNSLKIIAKVTAIQYLGEEITEYTE